MKTNKRFMLSALAVLALAVSMAACGADNTTTPPVSQPAQTLPTPPAEYSIITFGPYDLSPSRTGVGFVPIVREVGTLRVRIQWASADDKSYANVQLYLFPQPYPEHWGCGMEECNGWIAEATIPANATSRELTYENKVAGARYAVNFRNIGPADAKNLIGGIYMTPQGPTVGSATTTEVPEMVRWEFTDSGRVRITPYSPKE